MPGALWDWLGMLICNFRGLTASCALGKALGGVSLHCKNMKNKPPDIEKKESMLFINPIWILSQIIKILFDTTLNSSIHCFIWFFYRLKYKSHLHFWPKNLTRQEFLLDYYYQMALYPSVNGFIFPVCCTWLYVW